MIEIIFRLAGRTYVRPKYNLLGSPPSVFWECAFLSFREERVHGVRVPQGVSRPCTLALAKIELSTYLLPSRGGHSSPRYR